MSERGLNGQSLKDGSGFHRTKDAKYEIANSWTRFHRAGRIALLGIARLCAAEDRQGVQGRVAGQQSGKSGEGNYGSGIHKPVPHG
jgi:hypothetical protein